MKGMFTLKTAEGSRRLLALFIALILVFGFFAREIQTDGGRIKVEQITIDARGAELTAELYYPAGTTSKDTYPGIVITHGGGCTYMVSRIWAEELARRDFVVLNVSVYGAGTSAQPDYDDAEAGIESFDGNHTSMGLLDAKAFIQSLSFVDETRIGMAGHSMGSRRTGYAAVLDCGYLTLNDRLINVLNETFGVEFTESEINNDAYTVAAEKLNADQLAYFTDLAEEVTYDYNCELQSICIIGGDAPVVNLMQTVTVAGCEVQRNCVVNMCVLNGDFDTGYYNFTSRDSTKESWHTGGVDAELETWYDIDDVNSVNTVVGKLGDSVASNAALKEAIDGRTARIIIRNNETHSKNFFSSATTSDLVRYFEQALQYNRGDIGSGTPLDASNMTWYWRSICNCLSMFSMFGMLIAIASLLLKTKPYEVCVAEKPVSKTKFNKKLYYVFAAATVVMSYICIRLTNKNGFFLYNPGDFLPLGRTATMTVYFLLSLTIMAAILLAANVILGKVKGGETGLCGMFGGSVCGALRSIWLGIVLGIAAYISLGVLNYFFAQDYRLWMTAFSFMKAEYWFVGLRYALFIFPMYIIMTTSINYTIRTDIPEWKDTLITVLVNSVGIWACCLVNILIAKFAYDGTLYSSFICSYQFNLCVPITVYLARKLYKQTGNIWTGATLNTFIIVWSMMCSLGINDMYNGQTALSYFLNI